MIPNSFDIATAKEYTGDERMRGIESIARKDAETLNFRPLSTSDFGATTYAGQIAESMAYRVYIAAYDARIARNERKATQ